MSPEFGGRGLKLGSIPTRYEVFSKVLYFSASISKSAKGGGGGWGGIILLSYCEI